MVNMKLAALVAVSSARMGDNFAPALEQPRQLEGTTEAATADKQAVLTLLEAEIKKQGATLTDKLTDAAEIKTKAEDYYTALEAKFGGKAEEMKKALTAENVTKLFKQKTEGVLATKDELLDTLPSMDFFKSFEEKLKEWKKKFTKWGASLTTELDKRFEEAQKKAGAGKDKALIAVHKAIGKLIEGADVTTQAGKDALVESLEEVKTVAGDDEIAKEFLAQEVAKLSAGPEGVPQSGNAAMLSFSALFCVVMLF